MAPTEDLSPAHVDPPAPPATDPQEPGPQVADAVSAARASTADAVNALTVAAERAAGLASSFEDEDAENPAAAPDQPRADLESLTDADSETSGAPDVASPPRRSRWGVWLLAVILVITPWLRRPCGPYARLCWPLVWRRLPSRGWSRRWTKCGRGRWPGSPTWRAWRRRHRWATPRSTSTQPTPLPTTPPWPRSARHRRPRSRAPG